MSDFDHINPAYRAGYSDDTDLDMLQMLERAIVEIPSQRGSVEPHFVHPRTRMCATCGVIHEEGSVV